MGGERGDAIAFSFAVPRLIIVEKNQGCASDGEPLVLENGCEGHNSSCKVVTVENERKKRGKETGEWMDSIDAETNTSEHAYCRRYWVHIDAETINLCGRRMKTKMMGEGRGRGLNG